MMVPCLQAYIQKSPDDFIAGKAQLPEGTIPYIDLIVSIVAKTVTNERASETECRYALSLFMCLLHSLPNKIDVYIPIINEIVLGKLGGVLNAETPHTRTAVYQVLGSALYYNAVLELAELEKRQVTTQVFTKWMEDAASFDRWLPKKLTVLGVSSIMMIPTTAMPPVINQAIPSLMDAACKMALKMKDESEGNADKATTNGGGGNDQSLDEDGDEDDEAYGDVDQGFGEDEDVTNEVDESYRKALQGVTSWDDDMAKFLLGGDWDMDNEDVDEDFTSPLDNVDELMFLNDVLHQASSREPEAYQRYQTQLPPESQANIQKIFQAAEQMRTQGAIAYQNYAAQP
jgi:hypothetical protein